jgi:transposase
MSDKYAATIFVGDPLRVTLEELAALKAADAEASEARAEAAAARAQAAAAEARAEAAAARAQDVQAKARARGASAASAPVASAPADSLVSEPPPVVLPCSNPDCPHRQDANIWHQQAGYWKAQHQRAVLRERQLQQQVAELQARVRQREQQLFGRKSESSSSPDYPAKPSGSSLPSTSKTKKRRGQQPNSKGHKRRDYSSLPEREEILDLPEDQRQCSKCHKPFASFPGTEDTTILEVEVRAYRRTCCRRRYRPTCECKHHPGIIAAPPPPRLIPKGIHGVSIWETVLLDKFLYYRPTHRLLDDWRSQGLGLSQGTLTDGLKRLKSLFDPLDEKMVLRQQQQKHWHGDETGWRVFIHLEGKVGHRWYLWGVSSIDVVTFALSPGRNHEVPETLLGPEAKGILSVDRYSAYKAMAQVQAGQIILAFCWAHVRRDFLAVGRSWPKQEDWMMEWLALIGELYHRNNERMKVKDKPEEFKAADEKVRAQVAEIKKKWEEELSQENLHPGREKVLQSMREHWGGLTVFVDNPQVPMDNNPIERIERGPVVGRKNYWGSGAKWSGELAAIMFSLFETLELNKINPRLWLRAYLNECAARGGKPPENLDEWLPWNLSEERRKLWQWGPVKETVNSS